MKNRLLLTLALLLVAAMSFTLYGTGGGFSGVELPLNESMVAFAPVSPLAGELTLVRTPDAAFLNEAPGDLSGEPAASEANEAAQETAEAAAEEPAATVVAEGDAKEVKEPEIADADGKEFKEIIDPKELAPIAAGDEAGGGGGGIGGGGGGGGGGGAIPGEVAAFEEEIEVEKQGDTLIIKDGRTTVIDRTIIRTVPQSTPVTPVPEPGSAFAGFAVAATALGAMFRRLRAASAH